jgi:hypothetical protein
VRHMPQVNRKAACIELHLQLFMQCSRGDRYFDSLLLDVATGNPLNESPVKSRKRQPSPVTGSNEGWLRALP